LYIKVRTDGAVQIPLRLHNATHFAEQTAREYLGMGLYYGIIAEMILYNAFLLLIVRDFSYLYYVLYVSCYAGFQVSLNGLGIQFLWPSAVVWNNFSIPILIAAMFSFMFLFAIRFLDVKHTAPRMFYVL